MFLASTWVLCVDSSLSPALQVNRGINGHRIESPLASHYSLLPGGADQRSEQRFDATSLLFPTMTSHGGGASAGGVPKLLIESSGDSSSASSSSGGTGSLRRPVTLASPSTVVGVNMNYRNGFTADLHRCVRVVYIYLFYGT